MLKKLLPGAYDELSCLLRQVGLVKTNVANGMGAGQLQLQQQQHYRQGQHSEFLAPTHPQTQSTLETKTTTTTTLSLPDPVKIMKWAENNPVVSAFGIWSSDSGRRTVKFMQVVTTAAAGDDAETASSENGVDENDIDDISSDDSVALNESNIVETVPDSVSKGQIQTEGSRQYSSLQQPLHPLASIHSKPKRRKQPEPIDEDISNINYCNEVEIKSHTKPALEWDVFLDPKLVRQVDAAMSVVDNLEHNLRKARIKRQRRLASKLKSSSIEEEEGDDDDEDYDLLQSHTAAQVEVDRLVSQLMKRTIIAHGSMSQLVLEAMGVAPDYNYNTVVKSSRKGEANLSTPTGKYKRVSLRAGGRELSLNISQTWDVEDEQRDFESLLNPTTARDGNATKKNGSSSSSSGGSKGMFMDTWIAIFSQSLSLLVKSSAGIGDSKKSSPSSSSSKVSRGSNHEQKILLSTRPAQIGQRSGLSGFLEKMFFLRKDSSFPRPDTTVVGGGDDDDVDTREECNAVEDDVFIEESPSNDSELLTNDDMFSPTAAATSSFGGLCGISLCLGLGSTPSFPRDLHASHKMARDIKRISNILGEPLRLVLDLKSRRVPARVWSRLIDNMRSRGLIVEGIGSFDMDELRVIGKECSCPVTPILFFHSVGDLQRACHANEVSNFFAPTVSNVVSIISHV